MKREQDHDDLRNRNDRDRDLRRRFASLARVKAPEGAVKGVYARVERLSKETGSQGRSPAAGKGPRLSGQGTFAARLLPVLNPARSALIASFLTLCLAVPATFFIGEKARRGTTGPEKVYIVRLVYEQRNAEHVAVIGDFNNWQKGAAEMRRVPGTSLWAIEIPLQEGLYRYAFLIDDKEWKADPLARVSLKDDFGKDNSLMVLVNEREEARL
jgi:hypothetical protein